VGVTAANTSFVGSNTMS
jgi:hypothetical protein